MLNIDRSLKVFREERLAKMDLPKSTLVQISAWTRVLIAGA